jgi:tRNA modification GTPase
MRNAETIVAQATPPGEGGIAVIRVSGPQALNAADRIFRGRQRLARRPGYAISHGFIVRPGTSAPIDEVLVSVFRAPSSYTGEDMAEISCHGGYAAAAAILKLLAAQPEVRLAQPGEFTRRAVLNGKLNLTQAEAILDLVQARSELTRQKAVAQLTGVFSQRIEQLRKRLLAAQTQLVARLEFGDDLGHNDDRPTGAIDRELRHVRRDLEHLVRQAEAGPMLRQGALVVIVGKPNVGKSSLFNRLLDEERAIVTEIPGTTRDCLEAGLNLGGMMIRLVDTAGWRTHTGRIEALGKAKAEHYAERADALLAVLDGSQPWMKEDHEVIAATSRRRRILVLNKSDLKDGRLRMPSLNGAARVRVSAKTGAGIGRLRRMLVGLFTAAKSDADFIANQRHLDGLRIAAQALSNAVEHSALDVRVQEVGNALSALHELVGSVTSNEILDQVFRDFCIGK